jgi:hypothetical protein
MGHVDLNAIRLSKEVDAVTNIKSFLGDIASDDEALVSAIESETSFKEVMESIVLQIQDVEADIAKNEAQIAIHTAKKKSLEGREAHLRSLLLMGLHQVGEKSFRTAFGTLSVKKVADTLVVPETSLPEIPSKFWTPAAPKLDKAELKTFIKAREAKIAEAMKLPTGEERALALAAAEALKGKAKKDAIEAANLLPTGEERAAALAAVDKEFPPIKGVYMDEGGSTLSIRK